MRFAFLLTMDPLRTRWILAATVAFMLALFFIALRAGIVLSAQAHSSALGCLGPSPGEVGATVEPLPYG